MYKEKVVILKKITVKVRCGVEVKDLLTYSVEVNTHAKTC